MDKIIVDKIDVLDALQFVNILDVGFSGCDIRNVLPILYSSEDSISVLVDIEHLQADIKFGDKLDVAFENKNFRYRMDCEIVNIDYSKPSVLTFKINQAKKVTNPRTSKRFDVDLSAKLDVDGKSADVKVLDISMGGVKLTLSQNIGEIKVNDCVVLTIEFEMQVKLSFEGVITWKSDNMKYGVKFVNLSPEDSKALRDEISKIERDYLRALRGYRIYNKKESVFFSNSRILVFSLDAGGSYDIKESLVKLGAENFDLLYNLRAYYDFINMQNPNIIIIDTCKIDDEIEKFIQRVRETFSSVEMFLVLNLEYLEEYEQLVQKFDGVDIIYRPFMFNEFEQKILNVL